MKLFDVAVIGSGPAGLCISDVLTNQNLKVALFEESNVSPLQATFTFSEIIHKYRNGGQTLIYSNPPLPIAQPKAYGGGLSINAGFFQRIKKDIFNDWPHSLQSDFYFTRLNKEYDYLEQQFNLQKPAVNDWLSEAMLEAINKNNLNYAAIPRLTIQNRNYFLSAIEKKILEKNGEIFDSSFVNKIRFCNDEWIVSFKNMEIKAKNIFLAAGPIQSPALLMRSNLIPRYLPDFSYHPIVKVIAEFKSSQTTELPVISPIQIKQFGRNICIGSSVTTSSLVMAEHVRGGTRNLNHLKNISSQALFYCSLSNSPATSLFKPYFLQSPIAFSTKKLFDQTFYEAIEKLIKCCFDMSATKVFLGGIEFTSPENLSHQIKKLNIPASAVHLFSTLPMGSDGRSLINQNGKLKGTKGLYVADASILPKSPGVNPQATVMAVSRLIAKDFLS